MSQTWTIDLDVERALIFAFAIDGVAANAAATSRCVGNQLAVGHVLHVDAAGIINTPCFLD